MLNVSQWLASIDRPAVNLLYICPCASLQHYTVLEQLLPCAQLSSATLTTNITT